MSPGRLPQIPIELLRPKPQPPADTELLRDVGAGLKELAASIRQTPAAVVEQAGLVKASFYSGLSVGILPGLLLATLVAFVMRRR